MAGVAIRHPHDRSRLESIAIEISSDEELCDTISRRRTSSAVCADIGARSRKRLDIFVASARDNDELTASRRCSKQAPIVQGTIARSPTYEKELASHSRTSDSSVVIIVADSPVGDVEAISSPIPLCGAVAADSLVRDVEVAAISRAVVLADSPVGDVEVAPSPMQLRGAAVIADSPVGDVEVASSPMPLCGAVPSMAGFRRGKMYDNHATDIVVTKCPTGTEEVGVENTRLPRSFAPASGANVDTAAWAGAALAATGNADVLLCSDDADHNNDVERCACMATQSPHNSHCWECRVPSARTRITLVQEARLRTDKDNEIAVAASNTVCNMTTSESAKLYAVPVSSSTSCDDVDFVSYRAMVPSRLVSSGRQSKPSSSNCTHINAQGVIEAQFSRFLPAKRPPGHTFLPQQHWAAANEFAADDNDQDDELAAAAARLSAALAADRKRRVAANAARDSRDTSLARNKQRTSIMRTAFKPLRDDELTFESAISIASVSSIPAHVLGLSPGDSETHVRRRFHAISRLLHPDRIGRSGRDSAHLKDIARATAAYQRVINAYRVLSGRV